MAVSAKAANTTTCSQLIAARLQYGHLISLTRNLLLHLWQYQIMLAPHAYLSLRIC